MTGATGLPRPGSTNTSRRRRHVVILTDAGVPRDAQGALLAALSAPSVDPGATAPEGPGAFDAGDLALLAYADRLTLTPGAIRAADTDALRAHGFDDRAIHNACAIIGYFASVNRVADGLGVELEPRFQEG